MYRQKVKTSINVTSIDRVITISFIEVNIENAILIIIGENIKLVEINKPPKELVIFKVTMFISLPGLKYSNLNSFIKAKCMLHLQI